MVHLQQTKSIALPSYASWFDYDHISKQEKDSFPDILTTSSDIVNEKNSEMYFFYFLKNFFEFIKSMAKVKSFSQF